MKHNNIFSIVRFHNNFPLLAIVIKQVIFWTLAFSVLAAILYLSTLSNFSLLQLELRVSSSLLVFTVFIIGLLYGIILGLLEYSVDKNIKVNYSLGFNFITGGFVYFLIIMGLIHFTRFIILRFQELFDLDMTLISLILNKHWTDYFIVLLIYTLFMTLVISFINQMEKTFGPGFLLPILLGRFRFPQEEERIFMFLDLSSSTKLAEELGHITYSRLIQECFQDINRIVRKFNAEIYQYVGDEVVISWPLEGLKNFTSVDFFFAVQDLFFNRKESYLKNFGVVPFFKAGAHVGTVTVVEVGEIKRSLAYHGDTLNVAARLESLCNELNWPLVISAALNKRGRFNRKYTTTSCGFINLKGREKQLEVYGVSRTAENLSLY